MSIFNANHIETYIRGLTQLRKKKSVDKILNIELLNCSSFVPDQKEIHSTAHLYAAMEDSRLDVLEYAIHMRISNSNYIHMLLCIAIDQIFYDAACYLATLVNTDIVWLALKDFDHKKKFYDLMLDAVNVTNFITKDHLITIASYGNIELFEDVIRSRKIKFKFTLEQAVQTHSLTMVIYAISLGCNTNMKGYNLMHYCAENGLHDIAEYLIEEHNFSISNGSKKFLKLVSYRNHLGFLMLMRKYGIDINENNTTLMSAASHGHLEMCRYLVQEGATMTKVAKNALAEACSTDEFEVVKYLLTLNPNAEQIANAFWKVSYAIHNNIPCQSFDPIVEALERIIQRGGLPKNVRETIVCAAIGNKVDRILNLFKLV
jgi:ankyrin repeat protein